MAKQQKKRKICYSGIGGQAVLEGIMMKNGDRYSVGVRKPDGEIEIKEDTFPGVLPGLALKKIPFVRGIFMFIDSLTLGMRALNYSADFYEEEEERAVRYEKDPRAEKKGGEKAAEVLVMLFAFALAIGLFVILPTWVASLLENIVQRPGLRALIEGLLRLLVFVLYLAGIGLMKDIKRLYGYHGAEHKCINCLETGHELTVRNVMRASRFHRRCGTSFLVFVVLISVILFFFIRVDHLGLRLLTRILLIPVVAGISYEVLRLAGRYDNWLIRLISAPGIWVQHLTTCEPDEQMAEVAIAAVEKVFDWKQYLETAFPELTEEDEAEEQAELSDQFFKMNDEEEEEE